jgi:hypothetical protein
LSSSLPLASSPAARSMSLPAMTVLRPAGRRGRRPFQRMHFSALPDGAAYFPVAAAAHRPFLSSMGASAGVAKLQGPTPTKTFPSSLFLNLRLGWLLICSCPLDLLGRLILNSRHAVPCERQGTGSLSADRICPRYTTHKYTVEKMNTQHMEIFAAHTLVLLSVFLNSD